MHLRLLLNCFIRIQQILKAKILTVVALLFLNEFEKKRDGFL